MFQQISSFFLRTLTTVAVGGALLTLTACGGSFKNSMLVSEEFKQKMFTEPDQVLNATVPEKFQAYSVYNIADVQVAADKNLASISARVIVNSAAGRETIELVGMLRPDGSASLLDLTPLPDGKNRLMGEAVCVDKKLCQHIIVNIYYNVGGKTLKKQFASSELLAADKTDQSTDAVNHSEDDTHESEKDAANDTDDSDSVLGEFVGAPRNETLVTQLYPRSQVATLPPEPASVIQPVQAPAPMPVPKIPPSAPPKQATQTPTDSVRAAPPLPPKPVVLPVRDRIKTLVDRFKDYIKPKALNGSTGAATSAPAAPRQQTPAVKTVPNPAAKPAPNSASEQAPKSAPAPKEESQPESRADVLPFPPAQPLATDSNDEQRIAKFELQSAPLINLRDGGVAEGSYAGKGNPRATIIGASQLPDAGVGFNAIRINANAHFGTGMLVSFLENAGILMLRHLGLTLFVGDMSLKEGGKIGQQHRMHHNGLDADIAYLSLPHPLVDSSLAPNGKVIPNFNFENTWIFLRLAMEQEFVRDAKKVPAVSRVFMSPAVKDGFCAWAKEQNKFSDPENVTLMNLVRREKGHHKHFHLSLKCSPHYPACRDLAGPPPPGTGCN